MKSRLFLFWNIGKNVYKKQKYFENIYEKYSIYCSYLFGMSDFFTRENIRYMKRFYCVFPIYYDSLSRLSWEHYKLLLKVYDREDLYFYYNVALFCNSSMLELKYLINNNYFKIIKER